MTSNYRPADALEPPSDPAGWEGRAEGKRGHMHIILVRKKDACRILKGRPMAKKQVCDAARKRFGMLNQAGRDTLARCDEMMGHKHLVKRG